MAADEKWYFTKAQLATTPSRRCGLDADKELSYRQQAANFIQDMGQRLKVTQLCINTAIVYMHRFYIFHSFSNFHRNAMAAAALFLAAKVEEQPRKLEHVITVAHWCLNRVELKVDTKSEQYLEQAQELVFNENVLLQTLGFDVAIDHPHTHVVRCCHLVRANKELAQTSYFMASNSLHLTTMCLQYKPTVVACFCIHLACKWSNWEIPQSNEGKDWFYYVDPSVSLEQLEQLTTEFLFIFDKCPSRLKKLSGKNTDVHSFMGHNLGGYQMELEPRKIRPHAGSRPLPMLTSQDGPSSSSQQPRPSSATDDSKKPSHAPPRVDYHQYKEKKAREAAAAAAAAAAGASKDVKPPSPHSQKRPPPTHAHLAKRESAKREMMARETAKREAMKQEASRREVLGQRPRDPSEVAGQHHLSLDTRDQRRPRDVPDVATSHHHSDPSSRESLGQQKQRPEGHHTTPEPSSQQRRPRDPAELPSNHHHHPDPARRDLSQRSRESFDPGSSNHHPHGHGSQLKRSREGVDQSLSSSHHQDSSQAKRGRESTDPLASLLDSSKRPRETSDSNHAYSISRLENSQSNPGDVSQHSDRQHHSDPKHSSAIGKHLQQDQVKPQSLVPPGFSDARIGKSMPSASSSQRTFNHSRHGRPHEAAAGKNSDQEQRSKSSSEKMKPTDAFSLRPPAHNMPSVKSPLLPQTISSRSKSPLELPKLTDSRPRSPLIPLEVDKRSSTPEVSRRMADILSRPSGHLFSPDDDRDESNILSTSLGEPLLASLKSQEVTISRSSKKLRTPEKSRESLLAPPSFILPSSPSSPVTPGKSCNTPTTPTSGEGRKRKRTQSSGSEPELVPVVRKLEQMPGFHSIIKDGAMGIKLPGRVPDMIQPIRDRALPPTPGKDAPSQSLAKLEHLPIGKQESLRSDSLRDLRLPEITMESSRTSAVESSSAETSRFTPSEVPIKSTEMPQSHSSSLAPMLIPGAERLNPEPETVPGENGGGEHHRKKKKEKHNKKDKDRSRDEKKHKHKKKERDKAREEKASLMQAPSPSAPIRITIPKEKLSLSQDSSLTQDTTGLKIKIPKERLKVESPPVPSSSSASSVSVGGLKIKIGKELMSERRLDSPGDQSSRKQRSSHESTSGRAPPGSSSKRGYHKQNGHPDRKVCGPPYRGRGRPPTRHHPLPPHPHPRAPHPYQQQYYPFPPPPPPPPPHHMYMYPHEGPQMYGYYQQPTLYQAPPYQPPLPMISDFQQPPPPPLPAGPPPAAPPPPPPPE